MSGAMSHDLFEAANRHAFKAAAASFAPAARAAIMANAADKAKRADVRSLPARTWASIDASVRGLFIMAAIDRPGDTATLARMPWESFTEGERQELGAMVRLFEREIGGRARLLW